MNFSGRSFTEIKMGASWVPVILFTSIWAIVGGILPFVLPRGPQKGYVCDIFSNLNNAQNKKRKPK